MTPDAMAATYAKAFADARGWSAQEFAELLAHPATIVTGDPESFVLIRVIADEAEILTLATAPEYRRRGRARAALLAAHRKAKAVGATSIFLEVADDNAAARALYADLGYDQVGQRKGYYGRATRPAADALVLRCDLNSA